MCFEAAFSPLIIYLAELQISLKVHWIMVNNLFRRVIVKICVSSFTENKMFSKICLQISEIWGLWRQDTSASEIHQVSAYQTF